MFATIGKRIFLQNALFRNRCGVNGLSTISAPFVSKLRHELAMLLYPTATILRQSINARCKAFGVCWQK